MKQDLQALPKLRDSIWNMLSLNRRTALLVLSRMMDVQQFLFRL